MKQLTIRECAFEACKEARHGEEVLFEIIREAFTGDRPEWDTADLPFYADLDTVAISKALSPDIFASVREESADKDPEGRALNLCIGSLVVCEDE